LDYEILKNFLKNHVSRLEELFQMLMKLEESKEKEEIDMEFLVYCRGGIQTCEKILGFVKDLNINEE